MPSTAHSSATFVSGWLIAAWASRSFGWRHLERPPAMLGHVRVRTPDQHDELFALRLMAEKTAKLSAQEVEVMKRDYIIEGQRLFRCRLRSRHSQASQASGAQPVEMETRWRRHLVSSRHVQGWQGSWRNPDALSESLRRPWPLPHGHNVCARFARGFYALSFPRCNHFTILRESQA